MTLKNQAIQTALQGNWQEAIDINKSLIKTDPQDIDALNRLALAYTITGKIKEAKSAYQKVINIDPLNPIALRNLKKIKERGLTPGNNFNTTTQINNQFLEVPGKTRVVELVNIAQPKLIELLRTGQSLQLSIKRLKIFVSDEKQYVGVLPDDIARRLIKFIKNGCVYEAYVKSANPHRVTIFIKEIKKTSRFKDQPSFSFISDAPLSFEKGGKIKSRMASNEEGQNETEENDYPEE